MLTCPQFELFLDSKPSSIKAKVFFGKTPPKKKSWLRACMYVIFVLPYIRSIRWLYEMCIAQCYFKLYALIDSIGFSLSVHCPLSNDKYNFGLNYICSSIESSIVRSGVLGNTISSFTLTDK